MGPTYDPLVEDASSLEEIQRFIDTHDLVKPLSFPKTDKFTQYLNCGAWMGALASWGISCFCPVILFRPSQVTQHYALKLDADSVVFHSAFNDCCCHIAVSQQTIPLSAIQDVQLQSGCLQTCFGLKEVRVQTAGVNQAGTPDVSTAFLACPEKAREAIQLAVKLNKRRGGGGTSGDSMAAPFADDGMRRSGGAMHDRLQRLVQLVERGVLTASEGDNLRVKVLAAEQDLTLRLNEAEGLHGRGLLTDSEFQALRVALMSQLN